MISGGKVGLGCLAVAWATLLVGQTRPSEVAPPNAPDAVRGKEVFEKRCTGCHALDSDREGPRLRGVYGRTSGTVDGFTYSAALKKAHLVWNDATLDQWLAGPDELAPGNDMEIHVAKAKERRDVIQFLKLSAGK
jgi:cytochrome c